MTTTANNALRCDRHGQALPAYVCEHLLRKPKQPWFGDYPSKRTPWPDAACADCRRRFLRNGRWTNGIGVHLRILCHHCYEDKRSEASTWLAAEARGPWRRCLAKACAALHERQERLARDFDLGRHKRWDWDQSTGQIVFSNDGVPAVTARVHFIGSISTRSGTWLWAWANPHLARKVRDASRRVRAFGEQRGFTWLTTAKWRADVSDGWDMAAVAAEVLGADGVYRTPGETGFVFMALCRTRRVAGAGAEPARSGRDS